MYILKTSKSRKKRYQHLRDNGFVRNTEFLWKGAGPLTDVWGLWVHGAGWGLTELTASLMRARSASAALPASPGCRAHTIPCAARK